ncbi:uncharacterized protein LOC143247553 isoform X2 [Tachypleus tridentatus]|uniref:uncharacterized protein LOC143247553 isoform X2 n=1 Tax=Tachypleus tridentatus TaxID=6853 RepID=UPI003FD6128C
MMHGGQSLQDRLVAARYALAGQGLARIVCKAATEEPIAPKKKHLDYLLQCTNEPNVSIPQMANFLIERTQHSSWVVVFKALVTVHHLMCYGNERFLQYFASSNCTFQLSNFTDKSGAQGYDMSTFIRRYSKYLNEKAVAYRSVAFDFCKVKRGKEDGTLRTMNAEKLLKTVPALQNQLDALLEFDCTSSDLINPVIKACFMLLFRDLIRLFACYNDGIINLLEKYFDMNKKHCREALDIYKKFLIRMDRVAEFLKVAENIGIDKGDIPDLTKAPSSLLESLEQHLATLEGKKTSSAGETRLNTYLQNAVFALSSTSTAFGTAGGTEGQEVNGFKPDEYLRKTAEEGVAALKDWKDSDTADNWKNTQNGTVPNLSSKTNPFLVSPATDTLLPTSDHEKIVDLFSTTDGPVSESNLGKASDELLGFSINPFADSLMNNNESQQNSLFAPFGTNGVSASTTAPSASVDLFATDDSFAAVFGKASSEAAAPVSTNITTASPEHSTKGGGLMLPVADTYGRSASPSPTAELMKGAGTTPILSHPPEPAFGEQVDHLDEFSAPEAGMSADLVWGDSTKPGRPSPSPDVNPFGTSFEPSSSLPAAMAATKVSFQPEHKADLFSMDDADFGFGDKTSQPPPITDTTPTTTPAPTAPPPSPFGSWDMPSSTGGGVTNVDVHSQPSLHTVPVTSSLFQESTKSSALDDLNFTIQNVMSKPSAASSSTPGLSSPFLGGSRPSAQSASPIVASPIFGSPLSSSMPRLDSPGLVGAHASPTPPSGLSSPAKSVTGGGSAASGFDLFGDVLQPQPVAGGTRIPQSTVPETKKTQPPPKGIVKGDLDSSLASLAQNLDISGPSKQQKFGGHQWGSPKPSSKTSVASTVGGGGWVGPSSGMSANAGWGSPQHNYQPMGGTGQFGSGGTGTMSNSFPQQPMSNIQQQNFGMGGVMRPQIVPSGMGMGTGMSMSMGMGVTQPKQPLGMFGGIQPQQPMGSLQTSSKPPSSDTIDLFGAL